jgi:DNA-binding MarR family transcriptional regulator
VSATPNIETCPDLRKQTVATPNRSDREILDELAGKIDVLLNRLDRTTGTQLAFSCDHVAGDDSCPEEPSAFSFVPDPARAPDRTRAGFRRTPQIPLPDPRLLRRVISQRQLRAQVFPAELFSDPAWDILLDLAAAHAEHKRVSVTSLCIASGVPSTTALRWIKVLIEAGLLVRIEDTADKRRAFIALSDRGARLMARYFALAGPELARLL